MILKKLEKIVEENKILYKGYILNLLKSYLQLLILDFIYNSKYSFLIFQGGSCLRVCFDLPRLSEDLDFDYEKDFDFKKFADDIANYIKKDQNFPQLEMKVSLESVYLEFPVLKSLALAGPSESDKLYIKIDTALIKKCPFKTELQSIFKQEFSFLIKRYDLPDLMAGKVEAVLERAWFKGKKNEITIKGRDYFDLYWYMQKKITPNYDCIFCQGKKLQPQKIWQKIIQRVNKIKSKDLEYDLINLVQDQVFVRNFCKNYKTLFNEAIKQYLTTK